MLLKICLKRGKWFYSLELQTRTYPFLTSLHTLFYKNNVKILPSSVILFNLLTPVDLAHMLMCDAFFFFCKKLALAGAEMKV
jgi:hypothetical protein